jgi:hypothetical protein
VVAVVAGTKRHAENVCRKYKQMQDAGKRSGVTVKTLKRVLKKNGLKTTGKKATLTRRAKKAHLKVGGGFMDDLKAKAAEVGSNIANKAADAAAAKAEGMVNKAIGARRRR